MSAGVAKNLAASERSRRLKETLAFDCAFRTRTDESQY